MQRLGGPTHEQYRADGIYGAVMETHRVFGVRNSVLDDADDDTAEDRLAGTHTSSCVCDHDYEAGKPANISTKGARGSSRSLADPGSASSSGTGPRRGDPGFLSS